MSQHKLNKDSTANLEGQRRALLVVDAAGVLHDDGHLRFIEDRLWDDSQHPTGPN